MPAVDRPLQAVEISGGRTFKQLKQGYKCLLSCLLVAVHPTNVSETLMSLTIHRLTVLQAWLSANGTDLIR